MSVNDNEEKRILRVTELYKCFKGGKEGVQAVDGVSFSVSSGEILGFLGPNGAGKTTTIKMASGLLRPDRGTVAICGRDPHEEPEARRSLGSVLEGNRNLYWRLTAEENLSYFGTLKKMPARQIRRTCGKVLARFGLAAKAKEQVRNLSRGMQQRLAIAVAVFHGPKVLLLDEPTLGLDPAGARDIMALIRTLADEGAGIVLTSHRLGMVEQLADRVVIMNRGKVVKAAGCGELLDNFASERFSIVLEGALAPSLAAELSERFGASCEGEKIFFEGSGEALYDLLAAIRPHPVAAVEKLRADLSEIFLKLTEGECR